MNIIVIPIAIIVLIVLVLSTINLLFPEYSLGFLSIDFKKNSVLITSYSVLVGSILSFLSIIFILYNIILQKFQYNNDQQLSKSNNDIKLLDRLSLINCLVNDILKNISSMGNHMVCYHKAESENPLLTNILSKTPCKSYNRLSTMAYLENYQSFLLYMKEDVDDLFPKLYNSLDFYNESLIELNTKFDIYSDKKHKMRYKCSENLKKIMKLSNNLILKIENQDSSTHKSNGLYTLLKTLYSNLLDINKGNSAHSKETNLSVLSNTALKTFIINFENKNLKNPDLLIDEIVNMVRDLRRDIRYIEIYSTQMASTIIDLYDKHYCTSSNSFLELSELNRKIKSAIDLNNHIKNRLKA